MWINLQVMPVPYGIKQATFSEKLDLNFGSFDSILFYL